MVVLCYTWLRGVSINHASNKLNSWAIKYCNFKPLLFIDNRQTRAYPHQTSINDYLRKVGLDLVQKIYQIVFEKMIRYVFLRTKRKQSVILEFDLTYLGYWGKRRDRLIKGSRMVKGTRHIRHYHGAMIPGQKKSLFVGNHHLANCESKIPFMIEVAKWLQKIGLKIQVCVIDREYYQYDILKSFKDFILFFLYAPFSPLYRI